MKSHCLLITAALILATSGAVLAGVEDYIFEPVQAELNAGDAIVALRLKHKTTGKPVTGAVIVQSRIDMGPDGMAAHTSKLSPAPNAEPGVYAFKTELSMEGRWLLSVTANVPGEQETVTGNVIFTAIDPQPKKPQTAKSGERKIKYYRNPMGLADTSPVPKKDWMGMDYIPVYEGEEQDDGKTVKVSIDRLQRSGVRTEMVEERVIIEPVRAVGAVRHDETRTTIVTMRSEGFIEDLFVNRTGQHVHAGEKLFRVYSPQIQQAQIDLIVAMRATQRGVTGLDPERALEGAMQRLRNLGVPESRIREVRETGLNPRTIDWPSPTTGDVIEKRIINGQRVIAGDELYRIVDHSHIWVIADVAEGDLAMVKTGTRANLTFRAYPSQPVEGEVTFIYPELRAETRTARVRIEVPNQDGRLKVNMYADVVFSARNGEKPMPAIPASALIDSGTRQVVLIAKGEGRFEPRAVKTGRRGEGYVEIIEGVAKGEEVVTAATFLIDAESNLRAALQAFNQPEAPK